MQARLATRHEGKATADFDLPAPNDATQQAAPEPVGEVVAWSPALTYPGYEDQRVWANGKPRQEDIDYWQKNGNGITYAYTRPAPGVPEGWRIFPAAEGIDIHTPAGAACYVEAKALGDRKLPEEVLHALCSALLAAQAKGGV